MSKIMFKITNRWKPEKDEQKLNEFAKKGWRLKEAGSFLWRFKKIAPQDIKYSIELSVKKPKKEKIELIEQSGWQYISSANMMNYYCTENTDAVPIHTDPVEYSYLVKRIKNIVLISTLLMISTYAVLNSIIYAVFSSIKTPLVFMTIVFSGTPSDTTDITGILVFNWIMLILGIVAYYYQIYQFFKACEAVKKYDNRERTAKSLSFQNGAVKLFGITVIVLLVIQFVLFIFFSVNTLSKCTEAELADIPDNILSVNHLLGENSYKSIENTADYNKYLTSELKRNESRENYLYSSVYKKDTMITDSIIQFVDTAAYYPNGISENECYKVVIVSSYYNMKTEWLAKEMYRELQLELNYTNGADSGNIDTTNSVFDDGFYYLRENDTQFNLTVFLRKGTEVQELNLYSKYHFTMEEIISKAEKAYTDN